VKERNWEQFESLDSKEQEKLFQESSLRDRGEIILHAHEPGRLIHLISKEELYLMTKEMDLEEKSEIIRHAGTPQLLFFSDVDCWHNDRIQPDQFLIWLETLEKATPQTLLKWLVYADYEFVTSCFKQIVQVIKAEREYPVDEALGDVPYFSLDDNYYVAVNEENLETVKRALEVLFENHRGRYVALLEGILSEFEDPLEEEAYQIRQTRLADRGFPEKEFAWQIYRPITDEEFERYPKKQVAVSASSAESEGASFSHYLMRMSASNLFLDTVLSAIPYDEVNLREGLHEELTWLANKVLAAEGLDFSSEEKVKSGIVRARSYVSLGLEVKYEKDVPRALKGLRTRWLESLFRMGFSRAFQIREQAESVAKEYCSGGKSRFADYLNEPYRPIFRALYQIVPEYYEVSAQNPDVELRDFSSLADIERIQASVDQIQLILSKLRRYFKKPLDQVDHFAEPTLLNLIGTLFASAVVHGKPSDQPLTLSQFKTFLKKSFQSEQGKLYLERTIRDNFIDRCFDESERMRLRSFWALIFQEIEEDLCGLVGHKDIDARFVSSVRVLSKKKVVS